MRAKSTRGSGPRLEFGASPSAAGRALAEKSFSGAAGRVGGVGGQRSELGAAERGYSHSAMEDLPGVSWEKINDDQLSRGLDVLAAHQDQLCAHLMERYRGWLGAQFEAALLEKDGWSAVQSGREAMRVAHPDGAGEEPVHPLPQPRTRPKGSRHACPPERRPLRGTRQARPRPRPQTAGRSRSGGPAHRPLAGPLAPPPPKGSTSSCAAANHWPDCACAASPAPRGASPNSSHAAAGSCTPAARSCKTLPAAAENAGPKTAP